MDKQRQLPIRHSRRQWLQLAVGLLIAPQVVGEAHAVESGQTIPVLDVALIDGSTWAGKEQQGKVIVYLFWATWCPVCVGEMRHYQALRDKFKERGLEILALSLDSDAQDVMTFRANHPYDLPMAMRTSVIRKTFGDIRGTPTLFIADRKGVIGFKHMGAIGKTELEQQVNDLL